MVSEGGLRSRRITQSVFNLHDNIEKKINNKKQARVSMAIQPDLPENTDPYRISPCLKHVLTPLLSWKW